MTDQLYVIGHPIAHSKSPIIHGRWINHFSLDAHYDVMDIKPELLERRIGEFKNMGVKGFNVTIPHKQTIMPLLDHLADTAKAIGAVNTVVMNADGSYTGHNTDAYGFIENLRQQDSSWSPQSGPVAIYGAGGAAFAAVYALAEAGCSDIRIINRTSKRADELQKQLNVPVTFVPLDNQEAAIKDAALIVNTTPCGMEGYPPLPCPFDQLRDDAVIYDIVYIPLLTPFLQEAQKRQLKTITGIGMLICQAQAAFELWYDLRPAIEPDLVTQLLD